MRNLGLIGLAALVGFAAVYAFAMPPAPASNPSLAAVAFSSTSCPIKGNISIDSGERIYHVPGQYYYASTEIRPEYGELWFCSEAEARAAGWRKSRR